MSNNQGNIRPVRVFSVPAFFDRAKEMRQEFSAAVAGSRMITPDRFVWDYWHIANQYTYLRTPALDFFSEDLFKAWMAALQSFGEERLGCSTISPVWLSYYIDGCRQELHADVPHGTWAFVYSLTESEPWSFVGGETLVAKPEMLNYWASFTVGHPLERQALVECIPPDFNQLVIFDARLPHGVAQVDGTRNPLRSRVVLHGWFRAPLVMANGTLARGDVEPVVTEAVTLWNERRQCLGKLLGVLPIRLEVDSEGLAHFKEFLFSTLISRNGSEQAIREAASIARTVAESLRFPSSSGNTTVGFAFTANDI